MKRIKLTIAYDGTNYCGWQIQPNAVTIESVLNQAIRNLTGEQTSVIGASRTDSGVHALGNVAVFDTESSIPPERFSYALNRNLPEDIVVVSSEGVESDWHPRYHACVKTYEYRIWNSRMPNPLIRFTSYFVPYSLDVDSMREAADYLTGEHDFSSFCNIHTGVEDMVRTIYRLEVLKRGREIMIRIQGNGFLYNMVRIITGTLLEVGRGTYEPEQVRRILEAKERNSAGMTAPPQGLTLVNIDYV